MRRIEEKDKEDEVSAALIPPSPTHEPSPPAQQPITSPPQAQPAPPSSPPQEQPITTSTSDMTLLNNLLETCTTLSHKVSSLEQDKVAQALEIIKLKQRVKRLEKTRRSNHSGLKRLRKVGTSQRVESSTKTVMGAQEDASKQGIIEAINTDEDITLENIDWNVVAEQMQKKHLDNIRKYQSLKRKPIYVRPIFEREYNKFQTFLKPDKDEETTNKRVAKETLLQESFKKLRAEVEVLGSHSIQETPTDDPKEMFEDDVKNML
nr:hypothetical protein [Tanacetum cinerariifolium]